jgi:hypothetical protein
MEILVGIRMRSHPRPPRRLFGAFCECPACGAEPFLDTVENGHKVMQRAGVRCLFVLDVLDGGEEIA